MKKYKFTRFVMLEGADGISGRLSRHPAVHFVPAITFIVQVNGDQKKRGQDKNPASYKIQYPMKNHNKDAGKNGNAARCG